MSEIRDVLKIKPQPKLLRKLAAYILTAPPEKFDMGRFCGTSRCAFGHAPAIREIREKGLRIVAQGGDPYLRLRKADEVRIARAVFGDSGYNIDNFEHAQFVFGITSEEADQVFSGDLASRKQASRKQVSNRLIRLAAKYEKVRPTKKALKIKKRKAA